MNGTGTNDELVIELSKSKAVLLILIALAGVAGGIWLLSMDERTIARDLPIEDPLFVHGVGIACIVFSGLCSILAVRKFFDKRPGLVLNSTGIIDNSSGIAAGFIPWSEITGAEIYKFQRQKMLIVKVRNPEEFIQRGNLLKRITVRMSHKMCGSPIGITANTLNINFDKLLSLFTQYQQKYGRSMTASA